MLQNTNSDVINFIKEVFNIKSIVFTGGGTAGHVTPNLALIPIFLNAGYKVSYVGSFDGIEKTLVEDIGVKYYGINSGKLRRYFDLKNLTDIFKIIQGLSDAISILKKLKPDVVFSKGGFVSCPVIWAARLLKIPSVIHESDITTGLANKLSIPFANKICYAFPETGSVLPADKSVLTGIPVRKEIFSGNRNTGLKKCGFTGKKPVILAMGGSQGSRYLNEIIEKALDELLKEFDICHICGKGNLNKEISAKSGYKVFEYVSDGLSDLFAMTDIFLSRAGATSIFEILELKKPNILVPLSEKVSRGDQVLNALSFEKSGFSRVIKEEELTETLLVEELKSVYLNRKIYVDKMEKHIAGDAGTMVFNVVKSVHK